MIRIFYVDAFTKELFKGNPAAVCILEEWPGDDVLQAIAFENNLSETAFVNLRENPLQIRWFTPTLEVELCGHATLATARILFDEYFPSETKISFQSKSGELVALQKDDMINLDFPIDPSWAQYRGVNQIMAVGSQNDHDVVQRFDPVHLGAEHRNNCVRYIVGTHGATRAQYRLRLVNKYEG